MAACGAAAEPAQSGETLGEALAAAYAQNPGLLSDRASARSVDEEYVQARAGLRPTVGVSANVARGSSQGAYFLPTPALTNTSEELLQITQPLYTGGKVANSEDAAEADAWAAHASVRTAEIQMLQSVIQSYLDIRRDEAQMAILHDSSDALDGQLAETKARFNVGEVTRTDVAEAQARVAQAAAQLSQSEGDLTVARSNFASLVGHEPDILAPEPPISQLIPAKLDAAIEVATHASPLIIQAAYTARASAARVGEAKSAYRPIVSLSASLGYVGGAQTAAPVADPFSKSQPDVTIAATATIPLFAGGAGFSLVRQAAEKNNADRYAEDNVRRQVTQVVSQAWSELRVARATLAAYQSQVEADTSAFEGARKEEQAGLRTTIDVLNAEQEMQTAQIALNNARHDEYVASAALLAAMGTLEIGAFAPTTPRYDPDANFQKQKRSFGWVPWEGVVDAIDHAGAGGADTKLR